MVVYLDLIFLINWVLDGVMIWATAQARRVPLPWWRLLCASAFGAGYVLTLFVPSMSFLFTFVAKCAVSVGIIWIAFGYGSLQHFLRNTGVFYLLNFAAAGCIFGIRYVLQSSDEVLNGIWMTRSGGFRFEWNAIGPAALAVLLLLALALYRTVFLGAKRREAMTDYIAEVHIWIDGVETVCAGLIDTGNQLYDPLTRTPVMVMQADQWKSVMPESWLALIRRAEADQIIAAIGGEEFVWQDRLRLVPYRGVNRGTRFMLAVKPDKVAIVHGQTTVETEKVLVALDGGSLSSDGAYQAIIHPMLVRTHAS